MSHFAKQVLSGLPQPTRAGMSNHFDAMPRHTIRSPHDAARPPVIAAVVVLTIGLGLLATWRPARRPANVNVYGGTQAGVA